MKVTNKVKSKLCVFIFKVKELEHEKILLQAENNRLKQDRNSVARRELLQKVLTIPASFLVDLPAHKLKGTVVCLSL